MGNILPIWSYSDNGSEEKIANCFPYYGQDEDNFCGMVKIGSISSGQDEVFEKTDENFIKKTSLSLQLSDVVKRACGEQDFDFGNVVFGPISNERDENGDLINSSIEISLSLDEADEPEILDKEIEKGFCKGNLISYISSDAPSPGPEPPSPEPPEPDWQGFILKVDATIPPENNIWENQIEGQADMVAGGTFTINNDEVIFDTNSYAYYLINAGIHQQILNQFTFYLIAKAEDIDLETTNKHQDILYMGAFNYEMPGNPVGCDIAQTDQLISLKRVGNDRLILNQSTNFWKDYHIYTFIKEENVNSISCYIDGEYLDDLSTTTSSSTVSSNIAIYLNSYLKAWGRQNPPPSTLNGYPNHYKLFAYSNEVHNQENVAHYVDYFKSHYNVQTEVS